jgi:hypothetical protein
MKMRTLRTWVLVLLGLGVGLALTACGLNAPAGTAGISEQEARQIAEGALLALNGGDYPAFVENFDEVLRKALDEERFNELRAILQESSGKFLSLSRPKPVKANFPDAVEYVYDCQFEKEKVTLTNYYRVGGELVVGTFVDSPSLRKANP